MPMIPRLAEVPEWIGFRKRISGIRILWLGDVIGDNQAFLCFFNNVNFGGELADLWSFNLNLHLGSISSTFYPQLLSVQIPKAQKDTDNLIESFSFGNLGKKYWLNRPLFWLCGSKH